MIAILTTLIGIGLVVRANVPRKRELFKRPLNLNKWNAK